MKDFAKAINSNSIIEMQRIPKSDLHSHARRSGHVSYIEAWAGVQINKPPKVFDSLEHMQEWFDVEIFPYCKGISGNIKRLEGAFVQASNDSLSVLSMSFSSSAVSLLGTTQQYIGKLKELNKTFAPNTLFLPELTFDRGCDVEYEYSLLEEIFSYNYFKSIDICCSEFAQPIKNFKKIFRLAKSKGLLLRAHVGEFGTADDVMEAVEELELQEVHHGIAAANSNQIMLWLADNKIQLNICPSSNIMLGIVENYASHPIRKLYDAGIPVTINTDDLLIFNQTVSQEYLNLYNANLFNQNELNFIRQTGLKALEHQTLMT
jgi:adenosine deaminase